MLVRSRVAGACSQYSYDKRNFVTLKIALWLVYCYELLRHFVVAVTDGVERTIDSATNHPQCSMHGVGCIRLCYVMAPTRPQYNFGWQKGITPDTVQSVYTHGRPCDVRLPFDYTHGPKIVKHATLLFLSFSYAPKRPSPFFLYIPTKNSLSVIKYELTIEFLSANG